MASELGPEPEARSSGQRISSEAGGKGGGLAHDLGTGVGRGLRRLLHILRFQGGALQTWHLQLQLPFAWVKNPPAIQETQETQVQSLGQGDPLEKEMATHSSVFVWEIPWTEEPGSYSPCGTKEDD